MPPPEPCSLQGRTMSQGPCFLPEQRSPRKLCSWKWSSALRGRSSWALKIPRRTRSEPPCARCTHQPFSQRLCRYRLCIVRSRPRELVRKPRAMRFPEPNHQGSTACFSRFTTCERNFLGSSAWKAQLSYLMLAPSTHNQSFPQEMRRRGACTGCEPAGHPTESTLAAWPRAQGGWER